MCVAGAGFGMCFGSRAFSFRRVDVRGAGAGWDRGRDRARWRGGRIWTLVPGVVLRAFGVWFVVRGGGHRGPFGWWNVWLDFPGV